MIEMKSNQAHNFGESDSKAKVKLQKVTVLTALSNIKKLPPSL
jgi:hypothetical protein